MFACVCVCAGAGAHSGFGQGGAQLLRPKVADVGEQNSASEGSYLQPESRDPGGFGVLMLKYAFAHILETLFL